MHPRLSEFEATLEGLISNPAYASYNIYYWHSYSIDEALSATITEDIILIPIVITLSVTLSSLLLASGSLV